MSVLLVQHGKSLPKEQDPDRGLSREGIHDVERIAEVAKGYGVHLASISHSGKKRLSPSFSTIRKPEKATIAG